MGRLSSEKILQEKETSDPNTISTLALDHKALSDVSCLVDFKNLERLDLGFNNLSSLGGLKSCINLKWLSVIQNKLQSLKGIEGLTKLSVLNAGKNKLRSIDEVKYLVNLRALILNENEIVSVCRLDQLKNLNTLVLSRNPVRDIGKSLVKMKSITKLSLSNCQLQVLDSSIKFCTELKELRLVHNDIKTLPAELADNIKLQNLDLGNNLISSWSTLKVLKTLVNLKNLNLQGNPIAEKDRLATKIRKLVPNLQIFNAKPVDKNAKNKKRGRIVEVDDASFTHADKLDVQEEDERNPTGGNEKSKRHKKTHSRDSNLDNTMELDVEKNAKKQKKQKTDGKPMNKKISMHEEEGASPKKDSIGKSKKLKEGELNVIDDGETPFTELFDVDAAENMKHGGQMKAHEKAVTDVNSIVTVVTSPAKKKKSKNKGMATAAFELLTQTVEVGIGGASTWGNE